MSDQALVDSVFIPCSNMDQIWPLTTISVQENGWIRRESGRKGWIEKWFIWAKKFWTAGMEERRGVNRWRGWEGRELYFKPGKNMSYKTTFCSGLLGASCISGFTLHLTSDVHLWSKRNVKHAVQGGSHLSVAPQSSWEMTNSERLPRR